ncbi:hypothetical protein ES708_18491 [subsurface metagenome]
MADVLDKLSEAVKGLPVDKLRLLLHFVEFLTKERGG